MSGKPQLASRYSDWEMKDNQQEVFIQNNSTGFVLPQSDQSQSPIQSLSYAYAFIFL
jgi:hypothetical protein